MDAYYHAHLSEFCRPAHARGKLFHFPDMTTAVAWLRARQEADADTTEEIDVSTDSPIPGAERSTERILRAETGRPIGPFRGASGILIFLKRTTETEQLPYSAVADTIRAKLTQLKLTALELKLGREWAPRNLIEDYLHPEEFAIIGPVQKPWAALQVNN
jgi:hypothetical protein